jgi:hypothetical protein
MKRHDSERERARRYSQVLVDASLTARRARPRPAASGITESFTAMRERWRAHPALWIDAAPDSHRRYGEVRRTLEFRSRCERCNVDLPRRSSATRSLAFGHTI